MQTNTTTFATTVLAAVIGSASLQSAPAFAEKAVDMNIQEVNGQIRLIVKREGVNNETSYEKIVVPADKANAREAELLQNPDVISVERDTVSFHPIPLQENAPTGIQSYSQAESDDGITYNDPLFDQQDYFDAVATYNTRLSAAHARLGFDQTIRVGIMDGGFVRSTDVPFVEGASLNYGRGPDFYNDDPGIECPNLDPGEEKDVHGHYVGQVAGALSDNGIGIAGAARNVELVAARSMNCIGTGYLFENSESVRWLAGDTSLTDVPAISEPVDVINMSIAAGPAECPTYMQDAIDYARTRGIPVVVSAGNAGREAVNYTPGNCDGVITVAATEANGAMADYSNTGGPVAVSAQGSEVVVQTEDGSNIGIFGTSFAAPVVTGTIASALSDRPTLTPVEIDAILTNSGKALSSGTGAGAGILDSMLFLDGAGVPRERITAQSGLAGEREQYQAALTHPAATNYLQAKTGVAGACELYEVNGQSLDNPKATDSIAVFSVGAGEPLAPTDATANLINVTEGVDGLVITQADIDAATASNRQLGVAHCNLGTGENCSVKDTVKALKPEDIATPAICT